MPNTLRVLLLSDTHAALHPRILDLAHQVDRVVHAGDIGNAAVLDQLRDAAGTVIAVRGNNDSAAKWPAADAATLQSIDEQGALELPGGRLVVEHGHRANPASDRHAVLRRRHATARLVVYGHSHRQVIDDASAPWIVNPGAAGRSRTYGGSACLVLEASRLGWQLQPFRFSLAEWDL